MSFLLFFFFFFQAEDGIRDGTVTGVQTCALPIYEAAEFTDWSSRVQVMIGQKQVGEVGWALAQELDLGDLIGIEGSYGKTKRGEPTIFAQKLTFLSKSLEPHPDKWGGLSDMEYR